jgi:hypothetical protein
LRQTHLSDVADPSHVENVRRTHEVIAGRRESAGKVRAHRSLGAPASSAGYVRDTQLAAKKPGRRLVRAGCARGGIAE